MVRGEKTKERRGGKGVEPHSVRGNRAGRPVHPDPDEDPDSGLKADYDDQQDPVDDDYIWPSFEEEEDI